MNIKRIASIAIIAALPFAATAEQTIVTTRTPAAVGANGTVKKAATTGPYVTNEPTVADQTHIATTAYVKGAYNSAIAGVNRIAEGLRTRLINIDTRDSIDSEVYGEEGFADFMQQINSGSSLTDIFGESDDQLVTLRGVAAGIQTYVSGRGVEIYTTWDDNDTTTVGFVPLHY